ncbi:LAME_0D09934g1_1 [Lachancea meyersii CBS 8951]|uniref:sphingosine kinase n=1 Tax=Lachancea meyersii CBS 8951 TaxID=1266667 RepID=A0A1G4JBG2_9SACH|nr:LAME_0D09934g1_1 [Lachancea meyersii CBS 8951]
MRKLKSYMNQCSRAVLTDSGVMIKSQHSFPSDELDSAQEFNEIGPEPNPFEDETEEISSTRKSFDSASLISCVTCLSDNSNSNDENGEQSLPANTLIPYAKILYAKKICVMNNDFSPYRDDVAGSSNSETNAPGAELPSVLVEVTFAKPRRHNLVPKKLLLSFGTIAPDDDVAETLMQRSYKNTKREKSIMVIINPHGGKGQAKKLFVSKVKPIFAASNCLVEVLETSYRGHASEVAKTLDIDKYDVIACASGDGIPHEVLNGLFQRKDRADAFNKLAITQLPCGSGNAMSLSCHGTANPTYAALSVVKAQEVRIDLMCCTQSSYKTEHRLSFLSQTYGVIAESDINTECIRWMGPSRFELGVLINVLQRKKYPCDLYVKYAAKSKNALREHYNLHKSKQENSSDDSSLEIPEQQDVEEPDFKLTYSLSDPVPDDWELVDPAITSNLGIFYAGKMPYVAPNTKFFPAALPSDGCCDLVLTDSRTSITRMAPILLSLDKGHHVLQPEVVHSKVTAYRLVPKLKQSIISVDGEMFPFEPLQVEVLPGLCKTLSYNGSYVETDFDSM